MHDLNAAFRYITGTEGGTNPDDLHTSFNIIKNSVAENLGYISRFSDVSGSTGTFEGNRVYNSTFRNVDSLSRGAHDNLDNFNISDNAFVNCLFVNIEDEGGGRLPTFSDMFQVSYSNFSDGMEAPSWSTDSTSVDPKLDDDLRPTADTPDALINSGADLLDVRYDFDGQERTLGMYSLGAYERD